MPENYTGKPTNRVDGPAKVKGMAKYAGEFFVKDLIYGVVVSSTIAKGKILSINAEEARAVPGVLEVLDHRNRPVKAEAAAKHADDDAPPGEPFVPLSSSEIKYSGQPVAVVIGETFEAAREGALLVKVEYEQAEHDTNFEAGISRAVKPKKMKTPLPAGNRGDSKTAKENAPHQIQIRTVDAVEHHNPMEPHASTVIFKADGSLVVYDKTQGTLNSQAYLCGAFGLKKEQVQVLAPFVGGAFGSALRPQYQLYLAALSALSLKRSVRVTLSRQQMFTFGHRPGIVQEVGLAASEDGALQAIEHRAYSETSRFENYNDNVVGWSGLLYQCPNVTIDHALVPVDNYSPLDMRAPGAATGVPALEVAMDELAFRLGLDPLEFRLRNYAEEDQAEKKPFSSKELRDCYEQGAARFGWKDRPLKPRSLREGKMLVGWGMASGVWDAMQMPAKASAEITPAGKLLIKCAITDIGTGTYTVMSQVAADALGVRLEDVHFELGNTDLPFAPLQGGSWTMASVGPAVQGACEALREKLLKAAAGLPAFEGSKAADLFVAGGVIGSKANPAQRLPLSSIPSFLEVSELHADYLSAPNLVKQKQFTRNTYAAVFVEVKVDEQLGMVKVSRVVSAVAPGRVINPKSARSQILGGVVWGIGQALQEESMLDHKLGRFMNHSFAEYHIPTAKDVPEIDVLFVEAEDSVVSPMGVKGLGEIGIVGVAGAIHNAIFHATGKRIYKTPITLDQLL